MKKHIKSLIIIVLALFSQRALAQINPLDGQFFHNPYIANPAMAGYEDGLNMNLAYRNQWNDIPGAPRTQNLNLDYGGNRAGLGFNLFNEKKADFNQTKFYGTFALHLPLNATGSTIHFGLSMGSLKTNYDIQALIGNQNDPNVSSYNQRKMLIDGDFGFAFTTNRFSLEGALYNLKSRTKKEIKSAADYNVSYVAVSYKFPIKEWSMQLKVSHRGVNYYDNIMDYGINIQNEDGKLGLTGIYHTNKSNSLGLSYQHNKQWKFVGFYNTAADQISNYARGSFELGLQVKVLNSDKVTRNGGL